MTRSKHSVAIIAVLFAALVVGCASPAPSLAPAPGTPSPSAWPTASPTLIGGSDEAHIELYYTIRQYPQTYEGIPASPGEYIYAIDVSLDSDKPVVVDQSWFRVAYRRNGTDSLQTYEPFGATSPDGGAFPSRIVSYSTGPLEGRLLIALPIPGAGSYGPVPVFFKPIDKQNGTYKVYGPVTGVIRTT